MAPEMLSLSLLPAVSCRGTQEPGRATSLDGWFSTIPTMRWRAALAVMNHVGAGPTTLVAFFYLLRTMACLVTFSKSEHMKWTWIVTAGLTVLIRLARTSALLMSLSPSRSPRVIYICMVAEALT